MGVIMYLEPILSKSKKHSYQFNILLLNKYSTPIYLNTVTMFGALEYCYMKV